MNQCKKITLLSLLFVAQATTTIFCTQKANPTAEQTIDITMQRIQRIPFYISNLSNSDFLWIGGFSFIGAAIGHIITGATIQLLDPEMKPVPRLFQPKKWTASQWLGTLGGAFIGGCGKLYVTNPAFLAQQVNQPLLATILTTPTANLKNSFDAIYVSDRFPRAAAFKDLDTLRNTLSRILESFIKLKGKAGYAEAKNLTPTIVSYITMVKDAMLIIKNDPRWLEECNASTLAMTQANIQGHQNAQLAETVIQLAHR